MPDASRYRKLTYRAALALIVILAGWRLWAYWQDPMDALPDTAESAQVFVCRACEHTFSVTPRERAELMRQAGRIQRDEMTSARKLMLPCPACGQAECVVAGTCPVCDRPFLREDRDGHRYTRCPACRGASASP